MKNKNQRNDMRRKHRNRDKMTNHHLKNRCMGGKTTPENLLRLRQTRHEIWHKLFLNMDLGEIIECLKRVQQLVMRKALK